MYTVLRFQGDAGDEPVLAEIAAGLVDRGAPAEVSPHRRVVGFSCEVSRSDRWEDHLDRIAELSSENAATFARGVDHGLAIEFDTAVDQLSNGFGGARYDEVSYPATLLVLVGSLGATLAVTIYPHDLSDGGSGSG